MMGHRKSFLSLFVVLSLLAACNFAYAENNPQGLPRLIFFHSPTCHKCLQVKSSLMPDIEKEFNGRIEIDYRDTSDIQNYLFLLNLIKKHNKQIEPVLPVFYLEGHFLNGKSNLKKTLRPFIVESLIKPVSKEPTLQADLVMRFKSFRPLAVSSAGLIDGINPCAFTVIVFFVSFLVLQGYRKLELITIGFSFIFSVFLTYLLIGLGLFNFLYRLEGFLFIRRVINLSIGIFSIVLGILALYDFFKFKITGQTEGLLLQLPKAIKMRIHSVIGLHYRRQEGTQARTIRPHILRLILSALITGFLVSLLEAVCTGQVYLPTITFVLKTTELKLQALWYLLLYNLMFIVPLLIIFLFALLGVTSQQFTKFLKKQLALIKLLMAALFFVLGIFLIWRL